MTPRNNIANTQGQVFLFWMASCLARTSLGLVCANFVRMLLGFVCALLGFSLKGFIFITAGEHSVTCGEKAMKSRNVIGNSQEQVFQSWMASCLAMTILGFVRALHSFSLKGFIFITAGERSVTCGEKAMNLRNVIGNTQQQSVQSWMASCLAMTILGFVRAFLVRTPSYLLISLFPYLLIIKIKR